MINNNPITSLANYKLYHMKEKFIRYFMDVTIRTAELSYARRLKVGAIIVKENRIISIGYNGTVSGWDNNCEIEEYRDSPAPEFTWDEKKQAFIKLTTKPDVLHAEINCITHCCKSGESTGGTTMFLTHTPCIQCSLLIYTSGIKTVYYNILYRSPEGIEFLKKCGVHTTQV